MKKNDGPVPPGFRELFVKGYWHKRAGRYLRAEAYGLKAFRLVVPINGRSPVKPLVS